MAAPKLNADMRRHIVEWVIAGRSNSEIRRALANAGYDADLSDQAIQHYRSSDEVKEATARKDLEAVQCGIAQRSERILRLARHAQRFERMLADDLESPEFSLRLIDLATVSREYRETLKDIGALVDTRSSGAAAAPSALLNLLVTAATLADAKFVAQVRVVESNES